MAYSPINWDEFTPITATNLDKMDSEIDSNESRITTNENDIDSAETNISSNESRISTNETDISNIEDGTTSLDASTYKGNDIDTDGDGKVDNALALNGENWEVVAEGNLTGSGTIDLLPAQNHYKYNYSVYS